MSLVPFTRTLPYVLRQKLAPAGGLSLLIGKVTAVPNPAHVTLSVAGTAATVPRLSTYTPTVGDACYCLVADTLVIAVGAVRNH